MMETTLNTSAVSSVQVMMVCTVIMAVWVKTGSYTWK